jgi:MarR family transcriptional regulator for hemolysin
MTPPSDNRLMDLSVALRLTALHYRTSADRLLAQFNLSQATVWPLLIAGRLGDGARQVVLAEQLGVKAAALVRVLDHLEASGHIERREDPTDRRAKTIHLKPSGYAIYERVEALLRTYRRQLFDGISDDDVGACLRVLSHLESAIIAHDMPGTPNASGS